MRIPFAVLLLLTAIPLGVTSGVMVVVGLATDERLTSDGWVLATTSGAFALAAMVLGSWLLAAGRPDGMGRRRHK